MLKTQLQHFLRRVGAYDRMRESVAYDCYQYLKVGRPLNWRRNEVLFYRRLFGDPPRNPLIFDVGANRGQRTDVFLQLGARVVAVEPDAANQKLLTRRYSARPYPVLPVTVVGKAVSDADSSATLWVHAPGAGINSLSQKWVRSLGTDGGRFGRKLEFPGRQQVETTTLDALIASFGAPYYIKVDVEGHEPSVLRGLTRAVPFLSFEVNLPEFLTEGVECIDILERLDGSGRFNWFGGYHCDLGLPQWLAGSEFAAALRGCRETSVEVLWKVPLAASLPLSVAG